MADVDIRSLDPDDLPAAADLRAHAFGGPAQHHPAEELAIPCEEVVAAYRGDRLVGTVATIDMVEWFGGRAVPGAGIAGVTVAPDQRGRGLARTMLAEAERRMQERGHVISTLFPTTAALYRSLGWEVAGEWIRSAVPTAELPEPSGAIEWAPVDHTDPTVTAVYRACAQGRDGWIDPVDRWWEGRARQHGLARTPVWSWIGRRDGEPVAAVVYHHATPERALVDIDADLVAGIDGPALSDALAFLGASGTTADRIRTSLPRRLLELHLAEPSRAKVTFDWPWMLRLVDLPGAMAARGWPVGLDLEVHLQVDPPTRAAGEPRPWVLRIDDGSATLEPGGAGTVSIAVTELGRLYAGGVDPGALASAGRLPGADADTVSRLRAAFAGDPSTPFFF